MGQAHMQLSFSGSILLDDFVQHKKNAFTSKKRWAHGLEDRPSHTVEMRGDVTTALNQMFADAFALHRRTRSSLLQDGRHLNDYRLLFEECSEQVLDITVSKPEHARKLQVQMLRSIGEIACAHHFKGEVAISIEPPSLLAPLHYRSDAVSNTSCGSDGHATPNGTRQPALPSLCALSGPLFPTCQTNDPTQDDLSCIVSSPF